MCLFDVLSFLSLKIKILQAVVLLPFQTMPGTVWLLFCSSLGHSNTYDEDFYQLCQIFHEGNINSYRENFEIVNNFLFMRDIQSKSYDTKK